MSEPNLYPLVAKEDAMEEKLSTYPLQLTVYQMERRWGNLQQQQLQLRIKISQHKCNTRKELKKIPVQYINIVI